MAKKSNLPPELFKNQYAGKRGKGELLKTIHVRLSIEDHTRMVKTLNAHKITQSNFIRYAVNLALGDIAQKTQSDPIANITKALEKSKNIKKALALSNNPPEGKYINELGEEIIKTGYNNPYTGKEIIFKVLRNPEEFWQNNELILYEVWKDSQGWQDLEIKYQSDFDEAFSRGRHICILVDNEKE